jgi:hypothetical protein
MTPYSYRLTVAAMRPNARFWHDRELYRAATIVSGS